MSADDALLLFLALIDFSFNSQLVIVIIVINMRLLPWLSEAGCHNGIELHTLLSEGLR